MSLRVWLPLNGDTNNYGLDDLTVTNNGATVNQYGKIGKCYYFNGSSQYLKIQKNQSFFSNEFSFCVWIYTTRNNSVYQGIGCCRKLTGAVFTLFLSPEGKMRIDLGTNSDEQWVSNYYYPVNTWFHVCVVFKNNKAKYYINGIERQERENLTNISYSWGQIFTFGCSHVNNSTYANYLYGKLNDIRFYDHALSIKEIKEISKALVIHYPLDNFDLGNENLVPNSGSQVISAANSHIQKSLNSTDIILMKGKTITVSADIKSSSASLVSCDSYLRNGSNGPANTNIIRKINNISNQYRRFSYTVDVPSNLTFAQIAFRNNSNTGTGVDTAATYYYKNIKIEIGNKATQWIPYKTDTLYTSLGLNDNNIYDSSGFRNDATKTNVSFQAGGPRHRNCAVFSGSNSYIRNENSTRWMVQQANEMTINLWAYAEDWTTQTNAHLFSCTESGGFNIQNGSTGYLSFSLHAGQNQAFTSFVYRRDPAAIKLSDLSPGWHMFTFIYDKSQGTKIYIDSILINQYDFTSYGIHFNTNAKLFLGCQASTAVAAVPFFNGKQSDFRLYYTALSQSDIKTLYWNSALLDREKNIYTYSYIENDENNEILGLKDKLSLTNGDGSFSLNEDGIFLDGYLHIKTDSYIPINPTNKIYKYEITLSQDEGNMVYIGFERYDANKTYRENNATVYVITSSIEKDHETIRGVVNLATDGVNPCNFIKLRILNDWDSSSTIGKKATIHYLSLKEFDSENELTPLNLNKKGCVNLSGMVEKPWLENVDINKSFELNGNNFYEF